MSAEGEQRSGEALSTATGQEAPRWVGPPTREEGGRRFYAAFEAGGQQFKLGERAVEPTLVAQQALGRLGRPQRCPRLGRRAPLALMGCCPAVAMGKRTMQAGQKLASRNWL